MPLRRTVSLAYINRSQLLTLQASALENVIERGPPPPSLVTHASSTSTSMLSKKKKKNFNLHVLAKATDALPWPAASQLHPHGKVLLKFDF